MNESMKPFRIGMMGAGTVGGGVYDILMTRVSSNSKHHTLSPHRPMIITKILVRSFDKERDFMIDTNRTMMTTDADTFFVDTVTKELDIDCFVEVAGGCTVAKDLMLRAIQEYDIPVITANKAALFEHNEEFIRALSSSVVAVAVEEGGGGGAATTTRTSRLGMEAAVCGGIPIINTLQTCYVGDRITSICGICNGTTNYILSKMASNPKEILYEDALQEAQQLGFAEADPTADVEGHDVRAKIALLAQLAYGVYVPIQQIPCTGITKITANDFMIVQHSLPTQYTIKLIGRAYVTEVATDTTKQVGVYVTPMLVPCSSTMASVDGCGNAVQITSTNLSTCTYMGPGAGRLPTANSIVADLYRTMNHTLPSTPFLPPLSYDNVPLNIATDYMSSFYIRVEDQSNSNRWNDLTALFLQCNVTIQQMSMPNLNMDEAETETTATTKNNNNISTFYVILTDRYPQSKIQSMCQKIQQLIPTSRSILHLPILPIE